MIEGVLGASLKLSLENPNKTQGVSGRHRHGSGQQDLRLSLRLPGRRAPEESAKMPRALFHRDHKRIRPHCLPETNAAGPDA